MGMYQKYGLKKHKNQFLVGQSLNGSHGEKFLEIENNQKINLSKMSFFRCRIATNDNWELNWVCIEGTA